MRALALALLASAGFAAASLSASGPLGIYGIVERVVFEPDLQRAERVQIWGAFAFAAIEGRDEQSPPSRGYLYFRLPANGESPDTVRTEWSDLKRVAGTGQAVAFGRWAYMGAFEGLLPDVRRGTPPYVLERGTRGGQVTDLRVRPPSEPPSNPSAYQTNTGVVRLRRDGSHAAIVRQLQQALKP